VAEQELNLFEVTAGFAAQFRAGATEIVGAEALDPDLVRGLLDHIPDRPIAQGMAHPLAAFPDGAEQPALLDSGRGLPGVDPLLDPERNRNRADPSSLPDQIGQHPAALPQLDGLEVEGGELLPAEGAADQQCQDRVVAFALEGGTIGNGQQLFGLFPGEPVAQTGSLLPDVGDVAETGGLVNPEQPARPGFGDQLPHRRQPDVDGGRRQAVHRGSPLPEESPTERPAGQKAEQVVERMPVGEFRGGGGDRVEHPPAQLPLNWSQAKEVRLGAAWPDPGRFPALPRSPVEF